MTPSSHKSSSNTSIFNSLKRRDSKQSYKGGSGSTKAKHFQASRPPPGFVSYQIPAGVTPPAVTPSDNISSYDPRTRYSTSALSLSRSRHDNKHTGHTAGVHPQHLHNGGRSRASKSAVKQSPVVIQPPVTYPVEHSPPAYDPPPPPAAWSDAATDDDVMHVYNSTPRSGHRYTGEGGKKYRKSPVPLLKSPIWLQDVDTIDIDQESVRTMSSGSPEYYTNGNGKPPIPPGYDSEGNPKPPPRSRPKSWTSTFFNAFRSNNSGKNNNNVTPMSRDRDMSTVTLSSLSTNTMDKKSSYRFPKQVRFLANPSKHFYANQKFYSLPHFSKPVATPEKSDKDQVELEKAKARSRTPSPFGRFVKSLVKGNRGNPGKCVNLNNFAHLETLKLFVKPSFMFKFSIHSMLIPIQSLLIILKLVTWQ